MDDVVLRAMAKWPNVPSVFGWLSLDERGIWRIKNEPIVHDATNAFIARNYSHDEHGRWFFQNGPQRVFVSLDYTPWVLRLDGHGRLITHTGQHALCVHGVWVDETGHLLLQTEHGIGLVEDRDLESISNGITDTTDGPADPEWVAAVLEGPSSGTSGLLLDFNGERFEIHRIERCQVATRFGFDAKPLQS